MASFANEITMIPYCWTTLRGTYLPTCAGEPFSAERRGIFLRLLKAWETTGPAGFTGIGRRTGG